MKLRSGFAIALALLVTACAERPLAPPVVTAPKTPENPNGAPPAYLPTPVPEGARLSDMPGWQDTDPFIALEAVRATCQYKKGRQYAEVCADMVQQDFETPEQILAWLNVHFRVEKVEGPNNNSGLLTGYFVPDYEAQLTPDAEFSQPVRTKPADLVYVPGSQMTPASSAPKVAARKLGDLYVPYFTRAEIEQLPPNAQYYMRPEDYFFMQLQGSGFLDLPDGSRVYAAYAADNGWPFVGIAKTLTERGLLEKTQTSGDNIHAWLAAHRGPEAAEIMNTNPRYGFFAIQPEQTEPVGASGLALPPGSAIAIDPTQNDMGDLFWIDADAGTLKDSFPAYQRMVAALDTGGAIKGKIRADLYVGHGQRAGSEAGRIKHSLRMWRIVPYTSK
ncbi:MAG: MltA domain-containing protein [Asticcacaulis sp.]|uniref:MltA domain-containing protein n=1 Tax=Asticcacaulis sp. TaxID=1872648 RepID=UPI0039E66BBF